MPDVHEPERPHDRPEEGPGHGRLTARPGPPAAATAATGPRSIDQTLVYVPEQRDGKPYRLVLLLHGAGGSARQGLSLLLPAADEHGLLLVAPKSAAATWDMISGGFGPDVRRIDRALTEVFAAHPVAASAVGGFSDGASYALSLGLTNGDLFDSVLAFSPGFAAPVVTHGRPRIFVSHGVADRVLPIDRCSRRLVPRLRGLGHDVTYAEFPDGHTVPEAIVRDAVRWLA